MRKARQPGIKFAVKTNLAVSSTEFLFCSLNEGKIMGKYRLKSVRSFVHNILMAGSRGSGKTLLARALSGILREMSIEESLDVTRVYSVADQLPSGTPLIRHRPFRAPHWGDPLADWIMFCLSIRNREEEWQDRIVAIHKCNGMLEKSPTMQFRQEVYNAMDVGSSVVWGARHGNHADIEEGRQDLDRIGALLLKLLN